MASVNSLLATLVLAALAAAFVVAAPPPAPVRLGAARAFVILTNTGISTVSASFVDGDIGVSEYFDEESEYVGAEFTSDAIADMEAAYTDAAGRAISDPANLDIKAGLISGEVFTPGVYKWGSDISFASDIYIKGSSSSLFIFQTTSNVVAGSGAKVILQDDGTGSVPLASNIVWQVGGFLYAGPAAHLEGVFLVETLNPEP